MTIVLIIGLVVVWILSSFTAFMWGYSAAKTEIADQERPELYAFVEGMNQVMFGDVDEIETLDDLEQAKQAEAEAEQRTTQSRRGLAMSRRTRRPGGRS